MNEVVTVRPANLTIAPLFQSTVSEHPTNIFKMTVKSQAADDRRMSWVFRSPGNQLLLSPSATIQFQVIVTVPHQYCRALNIIPMDARQVLSQPGANAYASAGAAGSQTAMGPAIALGEGNAVMGAVESLQYTVNGGSISHSNWHLFKRSLDSCYIPARVAQRCFSQAGGSCNRYDATGISSELSAGLAGTGQDQAAYVNGRGISAGMTMDSGLQMRLRNFSDNIIQKSVAEYRPTHNTTGAPAGTTAAGVDLCLRIQAPLDGGVFNQVWGESGLSRSSPYQKLALAIPNWNQGSVTILYKDLLKCVVRRLGRVFAPADGGIAAGQAVANYKFKVKYDASYRAQLHLTWLRLQAFRRWPEAISLMTYRTQTYITEAPTSNQGGFVASSNNAIAAEAYTPDAPQLSLLQPSGPDPLANTFCSAMLVQQPDYKWDCEFQNLQFSQPPSYLFFCAQKQSECFRHSDQLATRSADLQAPVVLSDGNQAVSADRCAAIVSYVSAVAQNQDSNLAIVRFKMMIQSSVGSFEFSDDTVFPFLQDKRELFAIHKRNCCQSYLEDSGMSDWQNRCCCLLLSDTEYMQGLGTSSGTAFPIQVSASLTFQNRCTFVDGIKYSDFRSGGAILHRDYIAARAVCVGIYDKQVLQVSSSSSVLSAQNFTQSTTAALLAGRS